MDSSNRNRESGTENFPTTRVFSFNWDLSSGYRKYGFGFINNIFQHVGLLAYGTLYEYSDQGIIVTEIPPKEVPTSACITGELVSCQELGKTSQAKEEFELWLEKQGAEDFVYFFPDIGLRACKKLEVPPSSNWVNVAKFVNYIPDQLSSFLKVSSSSAKLGKVFRKLKVNEPPQYEQIITEPNLHSDTGSKLKLD
ncbi:unnamed protein product [Allacma fusca]|uniref:Uncharacterized protein n=1 Tax=Allacma fusca TaxID=39272 RepID=A0A8J2PRJ0_9HEXA|nr:unnamed protein product [Allacma fusca]